MLLNAGLTDINECVCWSEDTEKGYFVTSETALTNAIREDNLPKVQWLVSRSVNVNKLLVYSAVDKGIQYKDETDTPLMHAVRKESTEIVKLLLAAGADVNFKNSFGQNVLQVATKKGLTEIVTLLKSAGAKE